MLKNKLIIFLLIIIFLFNIILKINKENFNQSKYLMFTGSLGKYGISHHKSNLTKFILKANELNRVLIIPNFTLHGKHNSGKDITNNLSKYIDYNNLILNDKKFRVIYKNDEIKKIKSNDIMIYNLNQLQKDIKGDKGLIRFHEDFNLNGNIKFNNPKEIIELALKIKLKLKNYCCVHIRRNDRNNKNINIYTKSDNIIKKLKEINSPITVYIMTDEKNINIFKKISEFYNVKYYFDFEELNKIKQQDNYYLFQIENEIMNYSNKRISTFKTNNSYYHNYLVNKKGYQ